MSYIGKPADGSTLRKQGIRNLFAGSESIIRAGCLLLSLSAFAGCNIDSGANVLSKSGTVPTNQEEVRTQLARYTMPSELSAVPATSDGNSPAAIDDAFENPYGAADPGTDYTKARSRTYVEENTLERFAMLENILKAIDQTQYEQEIGNAPYKAMVAIEEENEGRSQKKLETWVVQSKAVTEDAQTYLLVNTWIEKTFEPGTPIIKAEFKIYSPPTQNADGTYQDYGEWIMNVKLDDIGDEDYFVATCQAAGNGYSKIRLYEKLSGQGQIGEAGLDVKVKAVMYRSANQGYGKIYYPDYDAYFCPECDQTMGVPHKTAVYAYNENYVAIQEGQDGDVVYRDRNRMIMMTHRYGVYDADTGADVLKTKSFGFPIQYTENGITKHAYYGAWQGRHEIWTGDGSAIAQGTTVFREDIPPNQPPEEYSVGKTFDGVLVKRTYRDADLTDIQDIPVEVMINQNYNLFYNAGTWEYCTQMDWTADPPVCLSGRFMDFDTTVGLSTLISSEDNSRKEVSIRGWDKLAMEDKIFVYEAAGLINRNQAGFYEAEEINSDLRRTIRPLFPRVPIDTQNVDRLWVDIWGSIFVEYKGASVGWVEKQVEYFDEFTWTPKFLSGGDRKFNFPDGMEFYVNMQETGYVVRNTGGVISVKSEIQTACNPVNVTSVLPDAAATIFYDQWNPDVNSTYHFITDSRDPKYMTLVYKTIGDNDIDQNGTPLSAVGDIAPGMWGLEALINGQTISFNWEYDAFSQGGRVNYLMAGDNYKLLDDALRFDPIVTTDGTGRTKTVSLGYDGWMIGLPDLYHELEKSEWVMTQAIQDKIINLPAGTVLTETSTDIRYLVKPLERSLFLVEVADPGGLDLNAAKSISLSDVPIYVEHGMGDMPDIANVSYSEGHPVE